MKKQVIPKPTESQIEATCTWLLALDGWRALKTDPVSRAEWGKGFGEPGMADRLYIRYKFTVQETSPAYAGWERCDAQLLWIEFKRVRPGRNTATSTSPKQDDWHQAERARGALTWIAGKDFPATIEGFVEHYQKSGLQNRSFKLAAQQFNSFDPKRKR